MKRFLAGLFAAIALWPVSALAQSGCSALTQGKVLTNGQWQFCFQQKQDALGFAPLPITGGVMTGKLVTAVPTTAASGLNLQAGVAPTSPNDGDMWTTVGGLFVRINGTTIGPLSGGTSSSFAATSPLLVSFPSGVVTYALPQLTGGLAVFGVAGNATGAMAGIQSSAADQVLRNNGAGTAIGFGSIDLSKSGAVGASVLGLANGGSGKTTAALARASAGFNIDQQTTTSANASYTILPTDRVVATSTTAMTGAHTWTLPAANSINVGQRIDIVDLNGVVGANAITIARAGSDTINGGGTSVTLSVTGSGWYCISDGVSKWSCQPSGASITSGVVDFNGRTGSVVSTIADYTSSLINYTNPGTGASARTTTLRLADEAHLLDWPVACNGSTADDTPIQNAINAAVSGSKTLVWPGLGCKSSTAITCPGGTGVLHIRGVSPQLSQLILGSTSANGFTLASCTFILENFGIISTGGQVSGSAILAGDAGTANSYLTLDNIVISGAYDSVTIYNGSAVNVTKSTFTEYVHTGISLYGTLGGEPCDSDTGNIGPANFFTKFGALSPIGTGIAIYNECSGGVRVFDNKVLNGQYGWYYNYNGALGTQHLSTAIMIGPLNDIEGAINPIAFTNQSSTLGGMQNVVVQGNQGGAGSSGGACIDFAAPANRQFYRNVMVNMNQCRNNGGAGIALYGVLGFTEIGNIVEDFTGSGGSTGYQFGDTTTLGTAAYNFGLTLGVCTIPPGPGFPANTITYVSVPPC